MLTEYSIEHHGVEHSQYWQGAGISGTRWDECCSGIGFTASEALDDALDQACMSTSFPDVDAPDVEKVIEALKTLEKTVPEFTVPEDAHHEVHYYITLYWRFLS